jgi:hypothetical protein
VADAEALTLIVGAGSSVEVGLPSWASLIDSLLRLVGNLAKAPPDSTIAARDGLTAFVDWIISVEGLLGAGAVAQAWLRGKFEDVLRDTLYEGVGGLAPGPTAVGVARLRKAFGPRCEIATTNYDTLLEAALMGQNLREVRSYVSRRKPKNRADPVVRHLHGVLTPDLTRGRIVIGDADYYLMQAPTRWQELYARQRLEDSLCLFVGTSLSDPNLLRYLYRSRGGPHVALFVRQGDSWAFRSDLQPGVSESRDQATLARWKAMNVEALRADYYIQSAQFVHEAALMREHGAAYVPYTTRLREWERQIGKGLMIERPQPRFQAIQEGLFDVLRSWLDELEAYLVAQGLDQDGELLGLHLWPRRPSARGLVQWGGSDRVWRQPQAAQPVLIDRPTIWVAVEAFCRGVPIVQGIPDGPSRWRHVIGVPIVIEAAPWNHLPVGVLTLASSRPPEESALTRLGTDLVDVVAPYLAENASELLTPP